MRLRLWFVLALIGLQGCAATGHVAATHLAPAHAVKTKHPTDPWFGQDKLFHAMTSAGISRAVALRAQRRSSHTCAPLAVGMGVTLSIGFSKELFDKHVRKTLFSWRDMFWNTVGALFGGLTVSGC